MARIPLAATIGVTASSPVPSNRGWITGGAGSDGEYDGAAGLRS